MSSEALLVSSDSLPTFRTVSEADDVVVIPQSPNTQNLAVLHPFPRLVLSESATRHLTARPISEASRHLRSNVWFVTREIVMTELGCALHNSVGALTNRTVAALRTERPPQ